jgi:hypothetical protein
MMDGQDRHCRVKGTVAEGQLLRLPLDHAGGWYAALTDHRQRRFDRGDLPSRRLIGPCAGTDVEDGNGCAERPFDPRRDARIGLPQFGIIKTDAIICSFRHARVFSDAGTGSTVLGLFTQLIDTSVGI